MKFSRMSCKRVLAIFAVAALLQLSAAEVEFPGKLVNSPYSIAPFFDFPSSCEGTDIYTVCAGCKSYLVCAPGIDAIETDCPTEKPYCNKNACSATLSSEYECLPDSLKCTGIGFYPGNLNKLDDLLAKLIHLFFSRSQAMPVLPLL